MVFDRAGDVALVQPLLNHRAIEAVGFWWGGDGIVVGVIAPVQLRVDTAFMGRSVRLDA